MSSGTSPHPGIGISQTCGSPGPSLPALYAGTCLSVLLPPPLTLGKQVPQGTRCWICCWCWDPLSSLCFVRGQGAGPQPRGQGKSPRQPGQPRAAQLCPPQGCGALFCPVGLIMPAEGQARADRGALGSEDPGRIAVLALTPGSIQTDPPLNSSARLPAPHRGDGDACRLAPRGKYQPKGQKNAGGGGSGMPQVQWLPCLGHSRPPGKPRKTLLPGVGGGGASLWSSAVGALQLEPCLDPRGRSVTPKLQDLPTLSMRLPLRVTPAFECAHMCVHRQTVSQGTVF